METNYNQQEILINIHSKFFDHEWQFLQASNAHHLSRKQKIIQACWDGAVPVLLPECFDPLQPGEAVLWQVTEGKNFVDLEYAAALPLVDGAASINPYLFMDAPVLFN